MDARKGLCQTCFHGRECCLPGKAVNIIECEEFFCAGGACLMAAGKVFSAVQPETPEE